MKRALYPGSFDPVTFGHVDLIRRALKHFDEVWVAVAQNRTKEALLPVAERCDLLRRATRAIRGVKVVTFEGLVVEFARRHNIRVVLRGVRAVSDFDYEFQMALTNRKLAHGVETFFLMPSEQYFYISSKLIKELASLGGSLKDLVPPFVEKALKEKLG